MTITHPYIKTAQLKQKLPGYATARNHALNHQTLQHVSARHREKFLKAFRYVQASLISGLQIGKALASRKHDGMGVYLYFERGLQPIVFHCPSWGVKVGLPAAEALGSALEKAGHSSALLSCELVIGGRRSHSYEVDHAANSPDNADTLKSLHLVILDVLILDQKDCQSKAYNERAAIIEALPKCELAYPLKFQRTESLAELNSFYQPEIAAGEEGIVVFDATTGASYKLKPKLNFDVALVGYVEGTGDLTGNVVSIMGALAADENYQLVARVGVADPVLRQTLFGQLRNTRINSTYTETDSDGRPIVWVKPTVAFELNAEEALWDGADGKPWTNSVITIKDGQYAYVGQGIILKPFHPTLERIRRDKAPLECTFAQLQDAKFTLKVTPATKPESIICREVYAKTIKGLPAIKKLLAWTQEGEGIPRFVIHTVDFSAGRAEAIKEDTKVTDDEQEANNFMAAWRTDEITKGWAKAA